MYTLINTSSSVANVKQPSSTGVEYNAETEQTDTTYEQVESEST